MKYKSIKKAIAYARFSSDMQREESINAQLRAINEYAEKNNYQLVDEYIDRAKSATTADRPEFQNMISDAKQNKFDVIIVHKFDRFSRDKYDSVFYKKLLKDNNVRVVSVLEHVDDTPEGAMLEGMIELMSAYYSKNLAREVEKGRRENALNCRHVGGKTPFGYDVDNITKKLVINNEEAKGVKTIFKMHLEGYGYTEIINKLKSMNLKTKAGIDFGKNSLYSILTNEKYTGVYVYNKSASKDMNNKRNGHKYKSDDEIIRIPNGVPQIISKEDFAKAQEIMKNRKNKSATYRAKETYLLSGKIVCGECGSMYCGNSRVSKGRQYVSYNCTKKNGSIKCKNGCVNRDKIEDVVLDRLADYLFNTDNIEDICKAYQKFLKEQDSLSFEICKRIKSDIKDCDNEISNLISIIETSGNALLVERLTELEKQKRQLEYDLKKAESENDISQAFDEDYFRNIIKEAKRLFKCKTLKNQKSLIAKYIDKVIIYKDSIEIKVNLELDILENTQKNSQNQNSDCFATNCCVYDGGERGI